jgi:hypothetical protein
MNDPNHPARDCGPRRAWRRAATRPRGLAVLVAGTGLALLAAGCGGGGLTVSSPAHNSAAPAPGGGAVGGALGGVPKANPDVAPTAGPLGHQGFVSPKKERTGMGSRSGVTGGALFGGNGPLTKVAGKLGRRLAIVRDYYRIGESFPTPQDQQLMASGSTLVVSLDSVPGQGGPSYAAIAAGRADGVISTFLRSVNRAAVRYHLGAIYISFEHEANNPSHAVLGSSAQFVKAWDHIHRLAQSEHLNWNDGGRLHWVLILMHMAYFRDLARSGYSAGGASAFFPGPREVDILAADGYNHEGCMKGAHPGVAGGAKGVTPEELFDPLLSFAHSHGGLPVFITEWGSQAGYAASLQPAFIGQMRAFVSANHEIAAALYFDWRSAQARRCSSIINNLPASLSAMAAMGHSPALQGRLTAS